MTTSTEAVPSTSAALEPKRRGRKTAATSAGSFAYYDATVSSDGSITAIGKPFGSEFDAQKSCARTGKPYLKIETLWVEFTVVDGKLAVVASTARK